MTRQREEAGLPVARIVEVTDLDGLLGAWRGLEARSLEPNVYYAPHYASALLGTVSAGDGVRFATAWKGDRLIAFLPVVRRGVGLPGIVPSGRGWETLYTFSGTPLLVADDPGAAADALVGALSVLSAGDWVLRNLDLAGPAIGALVAALDRAGVPHKTFGVFERAFLDGGHSFDEHMKEHVSSKRRRGIARNRRRLEELGAVSVESADHGPALARAVDAFLELEASGWKGVRGTALACRPESLAFAKAAFNAEGPGRCRADLLLLDGKPVAAAIAVLSGGTAFTVKGAYDEAYASYGVGLILEVEIVRTFLTERWAGRLDAATDGSHAIDHLWPGRMEIGHLAFSFGGGGRARTAGLVKAHGIVRRAKGTARRWLRRD